MGKVLILWVVLPGRTLHYSAQPRGNGKQRCHDIYNSTFGCARTLVCCPYILSRCAEGGVALTTSTYIPSEKFTPPPTLRITTNALHTRDQLEEAIRVLKAATESELWAVQNGEAPKL